jgi:hypothetical protein
MINSLDLAESGVDFCTLGTIGKSRNDHIISSGFDLHRLLGIDVPDECRIRTDGRAELGAAVRCGRVPPWSATPVAGMAVSAGRDQLGRIRRDRAALLRMAALASSSSTPTQIRPSSSRTGKTVIGRVAGGESGSPVS